MSIPKGSLIADWRSFEIMQTGSNTGQCDCCGTTTQQIWGLVNTNDAAVGAYFVRWTIGKPDHGAAFDLILGTWGEGTTAGDRYAIAIDYRTIDGSPQFMVVDAKDRLASAGRLAGTVLARSDVIGTALAPQVFAILDAVYFGDQRLQELKAWA